jgi:hypothetical protein
VLQNLPEDDRAIRQLHAEEVLKISLAELDAQAAAPTGTRYGQGKPARSNPSRLITSPVIDNRTGSSSILRRPVRQRREPGGTVPPPHYVADRRRFDVKR